jgi:TRAP-type C4-dicarboxylate transport system substrate-binding protein
MTKGVPVNLAGYQGPGSVMTQALRTFGEELARVDASWLVQIEDDVTRRGLSARSLFDGIEAGDVQAGYMASGYLSERVPELALLDLPFSVHDRQRALHALAGPSGQRLAEAVADQTELMVLSFWDNGFRHLSNCKHPIHDPDDCRGMRIRTLDSEEYRATMRALGFLAVSLDVSELRQAVADHRVDAQENPLANFVGFELWRHHGHVSLTGHLFGVVLQVCHRPWFEALTTAQGQAVRAAATMAAHRQHALAACEDARALAVLAEHHVQVVPADQIDLAAMRTCCEPMLAHARAVGDPLAMAGYLQQAPR